MFKDLYNASVLGFALGKYTRICIRRMFEISFNAFESGVVLGIMIGNLLGICIMICTGLSAFG